MNPIAIFFGFGLLAFSIFFVACPLGLGNLQKKPGRRSNLRTRNLKLTPEKQRQATLLALRDLDFDYQASKVAEEDYQTLRAQLLIEAAQLLENEEKNSDVSIEALIQSRRKAQPTLHPSSKAKSVEPAEKQCKKCQASLHEGAAFCSKCGVPVEESVCPKCNHSIHPEDRFCPSCGTIVDRVKK